MYYPCSFCVYTLITPDCGSYFSTSVLFLQIAPQFDSLSNYFCQAANKNCIATDSNSIFVSIISILHPNLHFYPYSTLFTHILNKLAVSPLPFLPILLFSILLFFQRISEFQFSSRFLFWIFGIDFDLCPFKYSTWSRL